MPDEFPTLEAVAALATLAALVRALQVKAALGELERLSAGIARALRAGDRAEARRMASASEGAGFARVASSLLDALDGNESDRDALAHTVEHVASRVARRSRRASTSGALIGLLLLGLLLYAIVLRLSPRAERAPSTFFDGVVVLGVLILGVGIVMNQRLAKKTRVAARRMLDAATAKAGAP
ncbi:MAG TPA: hypothetical protein VF103_14495 [Polyangiaceae bacterium]